MRTKFRSGDVVRIIVGEFIDEYVSVRIGSSRFPYSLITCVRLNGQEIRYTAEEIERVLPEAIVEVLTEFKNINSKNNAVPEFVTGDEVQVNDGPYKGCKVKITGVRYPGHRNTAYDCKLSNGHKISVWEYMIEKNITLKHFSKEEMEQLSEDLIHEVCIKYKIPRNWLLGKVDVKKDTFPPDWKIQRQEALENLRELKGTLWDITRSDSIYESLCGIIQELEMLI